MARPSQPQCGVRGDFETVGGFANGRSPLGMRKKEIMWCCSGVALFEQVDLTYAVPVPLAWVASCSCPVSSLKAPKLCGARLKDEAVAGARGIRWRPARWVEAR